MHIYTSKIKPQLCFFNFSPGAFDAINWPKPPKKITGHADYKQRLKTNAMLTIFWHIKSKRPGEAWEIGSKKRQRQEMQDTLLLRCKEPAPAVAASEGDSSDMTLILEEADDQPVQSVQ